MKKFKFIILLIIVCSFFAGPLSLTRLYAQPDHGEEEEEEEPVQAYPNPIDGTDMWQANMISKGKMLNNEAQGKVEAMDEISGKAGPSALGALGSDKAFKGPSGDPVDPVSNVGVHMNVDKLNKNVGNIGNMNKGNKDLGNIGF